MQGSVAIAPLSGCLGISLVRPLPGETNLRNAQAGAGQGKQGKGTGNVTPHPVELASVGVIRSEQLDAEALYPRLACMCVKWCQEFGRRQCLRQVAYRTTSSRAILV